MSFTSNWEWTDVSTDTDALYDTSGNLKYKQFTWRLTRTRTTDAAFVNESGSIITSGGISAYNAGVTITYTPPIYFWYDPLALTAYYFSIYCQDHTVSYDVGGIPWHKETQLWVYSTNYVPVGKL